MTRDDNAGDRSPESGPKTELRLKKGAAARGDNLCPSCGAIIEKGVVICLRCGLDIRTGKQFRTKSSVGLKVRAIRLSQSIDALISWLLLLLLRVAVVAVVAYATIRGYQALTTHDKSTDLPSSEAKQDLCPACKGAGKIKCSVCGGFGSVDAVTSVACDRCGGTGSYALKLGKSKVVCPFCKGVGTHERSVRQTCKACKGSGVSGCDSCGGSGAASGSGANDAHGDVGFVSRFWKALTD